MLFFIDLSLIIYMFRLDKAHGFVWENMVMLYRSFASFVRPETRLVPNKCREAVNRATEIVRLAKTEDKTSLPEKFDNLLNFLMSNFDSEFQAQEVQQALRQTSQINGLDHRELAKFNKSLVPIIVIRELFHNHKIPVDPRGLQNWPTFFNRYYKAILQA